MSTLIFPNDPTNGQVYPPNPIPGVNQYYWDAASATWVLLEIVTIGVTLVDTGTGLTGGPITDTGTISLGDTAVEPGSYTSANITVDAQGRITEASNGSGGASLAVETFVYTTDLLTPGESEQFEINIGRSYQLLNLTADQPVWIRIYGNPYVRDNDSRFSPGPTYPAPGRGFFAEFVTTGAPISMSPVVEVQSEFVNSYFTVQLLPSNPGPATVTLSFDTIPFVKDDVPPLTCSEPPFYCSVDVDPYCVTDFTGAWQGCYGLTSFPPINVGAGENFTNAWRNCSNISAFPALDFSAGTDFDSAWQNCESLLTFPSGIFDSCTATDFTYAWQNCALDQTSVDNILVSLDTAGESNGTVDISGGTSSPPGAAGLSAKVSLEGKGWVVLVNSHTYIFCTPQFGNFPVSYPPYLCETDVNTSGVLDLSYAWEDCGLYSFPCIRSGSVTDFSYAWSTNYFYSFPNINTSSGTNFSYSWAYCYDLTFFPLIDTRSGTNFYNSWYDCESLTAFPPLDCSSGTDFGFCWGYCESLTSFPSVNMSQGVNFESAWEGCNSLTSFPLLDTSSGTQFNGAWGNCNSLTSFPGALDLSSGTDFSYAWFNCTSLTAFPETLDLSSGTEFVGAWLNCTSLTAFPETLDLSSGTEFVGAWNNCTSLTTFPAGMFDSCSATIFGSTWYNCALFQQSVDNILVSLDTAGQNNGVVGINEGTSSAPGTVGLTAKASLEGKGWTVLTN